MTISIIKDSVLQKIKIVIPREEVRQFYIPDVYAVVFADTNEFSLFTTDTNHLLYERLKAVDFIAPTGTAIQIMDTLGVTYLVDNGVTKTNGYIHTENNPTTVWAVNHNLGKWYNHVTVIDSAKTAIDVPVEFVDNNNLKITFGAAASGWAYIS